MCRLSPSDTCGELTAWKSGTARKSVERGREGVVAGEGGRKRSVWTGRVLFVPVVPGFAGGGVGDGVFPRSQIQSVPAAQHGGRCERIDGADARRPFRLRGVPLIVPVP